MIVLELIKLLQNVVLAPLDEHDDFVGCVHDHKEECEYAANGTGHGLKFVLLVRQLKTELGAELVQLHDASIAFVAPQVCLVVHKSSDFSNYRLGF